MIGIAGTIVSLVLKLVTGDLKMDVSAAAFAGSENALVNFFLGLINPFTIWYLIVLGIGTAIIARASRGKALGAWVGVWVIGGGLIVAGLQAIGGIFGG
jgi:hypothetical protein